MHLHSPAFGTTMHRYHGQQLFMVCSISAKGLGNAIIPIPPYEEQVRIVTLLNKFDALVSDLVQGLPAEIAAVQEQDEYYRDKLLSFPKCKLSA